MARTVGMFFSVDYVDRGDLFEGLSIIEDILTLRSFDIVDIEHCKNELLLKEIEQYGRKIL